MGTKQALILLVVMIISLIMLVAQSGKVEYCGHGAGADCLKGEVLQAALKGKDGQGPTQDNPNFRYLEFDIQENKDGELVLFHDG